MNIPKEILKRDTQKRFYRIYEMFSHFSEFNRSQMYSKKCRLFKYRMKSHFKQRLKRKRRQ